jgi:YfiH family protein
MVPMSSSLPVINGPDWPEVAVFTTVRNGGVGLAPYDSFNLGTNAGDNPSAVAENRRRLRAVLPSDPLWLTQVHGTVVADGDWPSAATGPDTDRAYATATAPPAAPPTADAAVTTTPHRPLAILTADCLPVVIADADGKVLAVAHAGWRGLASGVLENSLVAARGRLPHAQGWRAWIGPAIGPRVFEVGRDVLDAFVQSDASAVTYFVPIVGKPGKWLANLPELAAQRLLRAGVESVLQSGFCTYEDPERFFSYRRDGQTGRIATLAWLRRG